jgi:hypothetical protein
MKRNWTEICKIEDKNTRIAISLANDSTILGKYEKGFPECFMEGDDEGPLKVPLSALMRQAEEYSATHWSNYIEEDRHFCLTNNIIPISFEWTSHHGVNDHPQAILEQLKGQRAQAGMTVMWCGKRHMVLYISFDKTPKIGEILTEVPTIGQIMLVDAEFVDLDV